MKIRNVLTVGASAAALFCGAATAHAEALKFTWVEPGAGGGSVSFVQDSNPTPIGYDDTYTDVAISGFAGSLGPYTSGGVTYGPYSGPYSSIDWFPTSANGGFGLWNDATGDLDVSVLGFQAFNGPDGAPVFAPGVYTGQDFYSGLDGTLTVTAMSGGVPEPATWAMLQLGLGAVGAAMRTARRRMGAAAVAA